MLIGEVFEEFIKCRSGKQSLYDWALNDNMTVTLCSNKAEIGRQIDVNRPDKHTMHFEVRKGQDFGFLW